MTTAIIEIVSFKLKSQASDTELGKTHAGIDAFLKEQAGFNYRSLSQQEDGTYLDIVYWQDLTSAQKASDALMQDERGQAMIALCDMESVSMQHLPIITESMSAQCEAA